MTTLADTEHLVGAFKTDLLRLSNTEMVQRYITFGDCFALSNDLYFQLKTAVANEFQSHHSAILIVGSAKLGFSIVGHKRYQTFGDRSDIDIAIISPELFDRICLEAYNYWLSGAYWPNQDRFKQYLFRGWLRPDKLPPERSFETRSR